MQELFCCLQESRYRCPGVALSSSEVAEPLQEHPQLFSCWSPDQFLPGHQQEQPVDKFPSGQCLGKPRSQIGCRCGHTPQASEKVSSSLQLCRWHQLWLLLRCLHRGHQMLTWKNMCTVTQVFVLFSFLSISLKVYFSSCFVDESPQEFKFFENA